MDGKEIVLDDIEINRGNIKGKKIILKASKGFSIYSNMEIFFLVILLFY